MEAKELIQFLISKSRNLLLFGLTGVLTGILFFLFSKPTYVATGLFFVAREANPQSEDHFTYEGYYSQQAGQGYTNSFAYYAKSDQIILKSLEKMNLDKNYWQMIKIRKNISVTKPAPQIIKITLRAGESEEALALWNTHTELLLKDFEGFSKTIDPKLRLVPLQDGPEVYEAFRSVVMNGLFGLGVFLLTGIFFHIIKFYWNNS